VNGADIVEAVPRGSRDSSGDRMAHDDRARRLEDATPAPPGERLRHFETVCGAAGGCKRERLVDGPGRWTGCAACLTVYDEYGHAVNSVQFSR